MYAGVVVLTYQAPDIGTFTYEIPKNLEGQLKIGQLAQVPFGKRSPMGIIISLDQKHLQSLQRRILSKQTRASTPQDIKTIERIVLRQPLLLPYQVQLLQWVTSYYFAPMVNCLEAMLPALPSKVEGLATNAAPSDQKPVTRNQTLVLVPNINRLPETLAQFREAKNYVLYHNQLKTTERFANWVKILNSQADFVFGSRSAIFSPCANLSKIIIFDEHDGTYKDERSPYFDTITIAEKLAELTDAKLEIIDSSPKITTYFVHKEKVTKTQKAKGARVEIVSMAEEKQIGNKSPVSSALSENLKRIYMQKGKALLFLNKKAESGQIYCRACKQQNYAAKIPAICPNCQSADIFFHSLNIISLAEEVKKIVPHSAIRLLAGGTRSDYRLPTVDISTSAIFYAQIFQKYDLVAHILLDTVLNIVDFKTAEKLYSQISDLKKLTKENGVLLLQTYNPQNPQIRQAAAGGYKNFYENELHMRKMLLYPPYSLLVKLTIKGKREDLIFKKAKDLVETLKTVHGSTVKPPVPIILGPYESVSLGKTPRYNIILKVKLDSWAIKSREKAAKLLWPYISKVPKGWQITVEPDSLN